MFLRNWRFTTMLLAALSVGMSFCHALELPVRINWSSELWVETTVRGNLYLAFGPRGVGAWIDGGAVLGSIVLSFLVRRSSPAYRWTLAGTLCFLAAHITWWALVFPANLELANWASGPIPTDWASWRDRWEFGHLVVAILKFIGFTALLRSLVVDIPWTRLGNSSGRGETECFSGGMNFCVQAGNRFCLR